MIKRKSRYQLRLQPWQCANIVRIITDNNPHQLKFPFALWDRKAVQILIKDKFNINLSIYDFSGKTISSQNYLKTLSLNEQISLIGYPTGIYLVKLRLDNGSVFTKRIIKTNQ